MPVRPSVNHTGLRSDRAVPKPCLSAGVNTAADPGAPGVDVVQAVRGEAGVTLRPTASSAESSVRMICPPLVGLEAPPARRGTRTPDFGQVVGICRQWRSAGVW